MNRLNNIKDLNKKTVLSPQLLRNGKVRIPPNSLKRTEPLNENLHLSFFTDLGDGNTDTSSPKEYHQLSGCAESDEDVFNLSPKIVSTNLIKKIDFDKNADESVISMREEVEKEDDSDVEKEMLIE